MFHIQDLPCCVKEGMCSDSARSFRIPGVLLEWTSHSLLHMFEVERQVRPVNLRRTCVLSAGLSRRRRRVLFSHVACRYTC